MRKIQMAIIDEIGNKNLAEAGEIAEKHCVLDASSESCCFIDLSSPDEVLSDLINADIITVSDKKELIHSNTLQLLLIA